MTKSGSRQGQSKVEWFQRSKNETDEEYFNRATSAAAQGPLRYRTGGASDLGADTTASAASPKQHYELQGGPRHWDDADLMDFLNGNGWEVHKIHGRRRGGGKTSTWIILATAPEGQADSSMFEDENTSIFIHPVAAPRRADNRYCEALKGPKQRWGNWQSHTAKPEPEEDSQPAKRHRHDKASNEEIPAAEASAAAPTQMDDDSQHSQAPQVGTDGQQNEHDKKRPAPAKEEAPPLLDPKQPDTVDTAIRAGWHEKDMGGTGDCFFRAWVRAENHFFGRTQKDKDVIKTALDLRLQAVKHMRKHYTQFAEAWDNDTMEKQYQRAGQAAPGNFDEFLEQASKTGYYVNQHLIQATVNRTGTPVVIWRSCEQAPDQAGQQKGGNNPKNKKLWHRGVFAPHFHNGFGVSKTQCPGLTLILKAQHYTCVLPPDAEQPPPSMWLRETHSLHDRSWVAGGPLAALSTPKKVPQRWGEHTPRTPVNHTAKHTPGTTKTNRWGDETPATANRWGTSTPATTVHRGRSAPRGSSSKRTSSSMNDGGSSSDSKPANSSQNTYSWSCNICSTVIRGDTFKQLSNNRSNHFQYRHKDVPKSKWARLQPLVGIFIADKKLPLKDRAWTCAFCAAGLPKTCTHSQIRRAAGHHYATVHKKKKVTLPKIHTARFKQYRKQKTLQPRIEQGKQSLSSKLKQYNRKKRNLHAGGHNLVEIKVPVDIWPAGRPNSNQSNVQNTTISKQVPRYTCTKCCRMGPYGKTWQLKCQGQLAKPNYMTCAQWKRVRDIPQIAQELTYIWNTSKAEADSKFLRLVEEGIEPHPGPSQPNQKERQAVTNKRSNVQVKSINTGGAPGVWRALKRFLPVAHILCLQEAVLQPNEHAAVCRHLDSHGYASFYSPGKHDKKLCGGVLTACRRELAPTLLDLHQQDEHQHALIQVGSWLILNSYVPPRPGILLGAKQKAQDMLHTHRAAAGQRPWLWTGDFNAHTDKYQAVAQQYGGTLIQAQTRWSGTLQLDHMRSNRPDLTSHGKHSKERISDHKCMNTSLCLNWKEDGLRGTIKKPHRWERPPGYTHKQWQQQLSETWANQQVGATQQHLHRVLQTVPQTQTPAESKAMVNKAWELFTQAVHECFADAAKSIQVPEDGERMRKWKQAASSNQPKALQPQHQWLARRTKRNYGNMQQRKQFNWLSRATRLLELLDKQQLTSVQKSEQATLLRRLRLGANPSGTPSLSREELQQQISKQQQHLRQEETEEKRQRIQQWQASMRGDTAERRRWIKRRANPQFPQVTHERTILPTDQQVLSKLHEHWTAIWDSARQRPSDLKCQTLLDNLPRCPERRGRPTKQEFLTTWRNLRGAAGPDNWTDMEVKELPEAVITCFSDVTRQWELLGTLPDALTFSRQVHIPKDSKIYNGLIETKHLRPINVYSLWYRLWSSTWAKSQLIRAWRQDTLPSYISGGPGSPGTEALASQSVDALQDMGWLATVDYSLAFDYIDSHLGHAAAWGPFRTCNSALRAVDKSEETSPMAPKHGPHGVMHGHGRPTRGCDEPSRPQRVHVRWCPICGAAGPSRA